MSFDASRFPFDPLNDFAGVVMQQGRVQLDSDWNEWLSILNRRIQAGTMDIVGRAVVPSATPYGFKINASQTGGKNVITIGAGRMYVDGLLVENHGPRPPVQFDPALAELSGAPQTSPPGAAEVDINFTDQPYLPGAQLLPGNGPFIVFLDVWQREVTYLERPDLVEKAVGIDTTGRLQTVWQVKLLDVSDVAGGVTCTTGEPWDTFTKPSASRLSTWVAQSGTPGPCCLTPTTGYTGRENQLYRVEIHRGGDANTSGTASPVSATFKWSRDNDSVASSVTAIRATTSGGKSTSAVAVERIGRDHVLSFRPGDWVEITDDVRELNGKAGDLRQIAPQGVDKASNVIILTAPLSADIQSNLTSPPANYKNCHTRVTRWDQSGKVYLADGMTVWVDLGAAGSTGDIPVPPPGTNLILENGVTVSFDLAPGGGEFAVGDHWNFAARTSDGSVEPLAEAPPKGIHHHYARLAVVTFPNPPSDCRIPWPPTTPGVGNTCACTVCVEVSDYQKDADVIAKAIDTVNSLGGGRVCLGPGIFPLGSNPIKMIGLSKVILSGQGPATILVYTGSGPAVTIDQSLEQRIEDLSIFATPHAAARAGAGQDIAIGLRVRNCSGLRVARCIISAGIGPELRRMTQGEGTRSHKTTSAAFGSAASAAVVFDGFLAVAVFRDNILTADVGICTSASLMAAGKADAPEPIPLPLSLTACNIRDNLMLCHVAGVMLGDVTPQQNFYTYGLETAIERNTVLGSQFVGIYIEGFTVAGASVRIRGNNVEVKNVGIDIRLDGAIVSENVITQSDYAKDLPSGNTATSRGINVGGGEGSLPVSEVSLHHNRVVGIAGPGIVVRVPTAQLISITDNIIHGWVGQGIRIQHPTDQFIDNLVVRGNEVLSGSAPEALYGIYAAGGANAVIRDNTIASIGNAAVEIGSAVGLFVAAENMIVSDNNIHDIGPTDASGPQLFGIEALVGLDVHISGNVIRQAAKPGGGKPQGKFIGIFVDGSNTTLAEAFATVSVQENSVDGSSERPLMLIYVVSGQNPELGTANCVFLGNRCREHSVRTTILNPPAIVEIRAATAAVSNNRILGPELDNGLDVVVTAHSGKQPAATLVGNIVTKSISLNNSLLPPPWDALNIIA